MRIERKAAGEHQLVTSTILYWADAVLTLT